MVPDSIAPDSTAPDDGFELLVDGLAFPEGPRWRAGVLWFSDMHDGEVRFVGEDGGIGTAAAVPGSPSGLGWDPDGRLLAVSMADRRLVRLESDGALTTVADLSGTWPFPLNDMLVDQAGTAYVTTFGSDLYAGEHPAPSPILRVDRAGTVSVFAENLLGPNGMALRPDPPRLVVAESYGGRVLEYPVTDTGASCRVLADLGRGCPDGVCLDAAGGLWVALVRAGEVVRLDPDGAVTQRLPTPGRTPVACALGGPDGRTLYVCSCERINRSGLMSPAEMREARIGRIECRRVEVGAP